MAPGYGQGTLTPLTENAGSPKGFPCLKTSPEPCAPNASLAAWPQQAENLFVPDLASLCSVGIVSEMRTRNSGFPYPQHYLGLCHPLQHFKVTELASPLPYQPPIHLHEPFLLVSLLVVERQQSSCHTHCHQHRIQTSSRCHHRGSSNGWCCQLGK